MEKQIQQNEKLWDKLAKNDVLCSRPRYDLTAASAKEYLRNSLFYGDSLKGKNVLCLASGGGQQSLAFALLNAKVTVVDFSAEQLKRDKIIAQQFKKDIHIVKTDMRDLSMFEDQEFDIVYQPYSINYIPSVIVLFNEIQRVLKPRGIYDLMFHNPFVHGTWKDGAWGSEWQPDELWKGKGYPLWQPYQDGYPIKTEDPNWNFENLKDESIKIKSPQEYKHTLSTILNGLINRGFELLDLQEETNDHEGTTPGTWDHYKSCAPPWMYLVSRKKEAQSNILFHA